MSRKYVSSKFTVDEQDRKARERAKARTAQASHEIEHRLAQQMKRGNFMSRMDAGGSGTLRSEGQYVSSAQFRTQTTP